MSSGRKASTVPSPPPPQIASSMSSASDSNSMLVALGNLLATQLGGDQDRVSATLSCLQGVCGFEKKTKRARWQFNALRRLHSVRSCIERTEPVRLINAWWVEGSHVRATYRRLPTVAPAVVPRSEVDEGGTLNGETSNKTMKAWLHGTDQHSK